MLVQPPKYLSPTAISTYLQCPLKFKWAKIDRIPQPKNDALVRGSFVHDVLESLYKLPNEGRTVEAAQKLASELWKQKWEAEALEVMGESSLRDFKWSAWWLIENLFKMEDPTKISPTGLETKVKGDIGDIFVLGYIDRWTTNEDGGAIISDYKTGKTPRKKEYAADYILQLTIYAILMEQTGQKVDMTELLFLKGGDIMQFPPHESRKRSATNTVQKVWANILDDCEDDTFKPKTSKLCDWCFFKKDCPAWN